MKKAALHLVKFAVSAAIIAFLIQHARGADGFSDLVSRPKHWGLLGGAFLLLLLALCTSIARWHLLVRALDLPFRVRDAFRLGFLGYLFNFVSLGSVGGDLFKAVFLAREQRGRRTEAVATIAVDRLVGMYGLILVAAAAVLCTGQWHSPAREIRMISQATLAALLIITLCGCAVLTPHFTEGRLSRFLCGLHYSGPFAAKVIGALRIYRRRLPVLAVACLLSMAVHIFATAGIYLVARGLPGEAPSFAAHFVIVPLGLITGILPLPLSGLGAFEGVLDFLYVHMAGDALIGPGRGLIVALGYRLITVGIAIIGVFYYLASRRQVRELLEAKEAATQAPERTRPEAQLVAAGD